nr:unnamed protein product [Callosobruchus analis]
MNDQILGLLDGDHTTYLSDDSVVTEDDGQRLNFTIEFLNSINPPGMPQHRFKLRVGTVVMLLRNLNTKKGLPDGTKLVISNMRSWLYERLYNMSGLFDSRLCSFHGSLDSGLCDVHSRFDSWLGVAARSLHCRIHDIY